MLKTWKKAASLAMVFVMTMVVCVPAFAETTKPTAVASTKRNVDYAQHRFAELDQKSVRVNGILADYVVYSDAWWFMQGQIGVGAEGWTDIDNKSDGSDKYHYSNIRVWAESGSSQYWESGRKWGSGRVQVSTGNVGQGALSDYHLYYGF